MNNKKSEMLVVSDFFLYICIMKLNNGPVV